MSVKIIDTLKPKNNGSFPIVEAVDVAVAADLRLPEALEAKADASALEATNAAVATKADASEVATATAELQGEIDQIVISASAEAIVAPEVAQARVGIDGTEYSTLKDRLDASDSTKPDFLSFGYYESQEIEETANAVSKNTIPRTVLTDGYSGFQTSAVSVQEGEKYKISGWCSDDTLFFPAFYGDRDSEIVQIINVTPTNGYFTGVEVTVPYAATRLCLNGRSSASHPIVVEKLENYEKSAEFFEDYSAVRSGAISALQFPSWQRAEITVVDNKLCNSKTLAVSNESGFEYIIYTVSPGKQYKVTGWGPQGGNYAPSFWGESAFISEISTTAGENGYYQDVLATAPAGATRLVLNGRPNRGYNIKIDILEADERSAGFWGEFANVKEEADIASSNTLKLPTWVEKSFDETTGYLCNIKTLEASEYYGFSYTIYPVSPGEKFLISGWGQEKSDWAPAFWSDTSLIAKINVESDENYAYSDVEITAPQYATRLVVNGRPNRDYDIKIKKLEAEGESGEFWDKFSFVEEAVENVSYKPLSGKTIVNFGDSIFGNFSTPDDISTELANITGAVVYNCGFSGCRMARHIYSGWDAFSMYRLAYSIANNDFSVQEAAIANPEWSDKPAKFAATLALLESIDFSKVDYITIAYGTNDFTGDVVIDDQNNDVNTATYKGALRYSLNAILAAYPHIRVIACTPIYRTWNEGGQYQNDANTRLNANDNTLRDFYDAVIDVTDKYNVQFIDNFHIGMSRYNRNYYWTSPDYTHPNLNGRKLIAHNMAHELY